MNRDFVYHYPREETSWSRVGSTLNRWLWGALCCGVPGIPCYFCTCCDKVDESAERERPRVNQSTGTAERLARPHRPNAPGGRKSTPEMLSAVRCALSQLQGEPAPPPPPADPQTGDGHKQEPG
ncbi:hypothetical protein JYU34_007058 [Plutella xylostella]|uniref:Uncharacterized protein n=2 Tax=Plutella xylostella TaxID=51655 RepID=A0ABQ7QPJ9_PLUXY|nr:uncharacterized protein LOC105383123 [Plutella xylostella]KAG7306936.1 hypothetical protein JYU34_007058 [Plutella xylostella]CAG9095815.1 unnamed protein product [Plutella xylostella]